MRRKPIDRTIRLYRWYIGFRESYFWMPVFFLFFASKLPLAQVFWLEAIYYASVVLLEIPSGYASDRFGRKRTLLLSSAAFVLSYGLFVVADSFAGFAVAQVALAAGIALASGTDTSLLYDALKQAGRESEYVEHEAVVSRISSWAMGASALVGGALATVELSWPYLASGLAALGGFVVVALFREPEHEREAGAPIQQLRDCVACIRGPLRWVFAFSALAVCLNHVPYELYQGYVELTLPEAFPDRSTPLITGIHAMVVGLVAGTIAGFAPVARRRFGTRTSLLAAASFQLALIASIAFVLHPIVVVLLLARGFPSAFEKPLIRSAIAPRVASHLRATYLSLQSFAGRLSYAGLLGILGLFVEAETITWPDVSSAATAAVLLLAVPLMVLVVWREMAIDPV